MAASININRAGKVRNHTPVCAKKVKPQAKTGRAAKREKFMKRLETGYFDMKGKIKMNVNVPKQ